MLKLRRTGMVSTKRLLNIAAKGDRAAKSSFSVFFHEFFPCIFLRIYHYRYDGVSCQGAFFEIQGGGEADARWRAVAQHKNPHAAEGELSRPAA
jgi:hypothetical protein